MTCLRKSKKTKPSGFLQIHQIRQNLSQTWWKSWGHWKVDAVCDTTKLYSSVIWSKSANDIPWVSDSLKFSEIFEIWKLSLYYTFMKAYLFKKKEVWIWCKRTSSKREILALFCNLLNCSCIFLYILCNTLAWRNSQTQKTWYYLLKDIG